MGGYARKVKYNFATTHSAFIIQNSSFITCLITRKLKVFLCHSSNDKPAVRELYARLNAEGWIDPWLDEEKLYPGQDWDMEIEKAVEETELVIAFLSSNSISKEGYIQYELRTVLNMAKYKPAGTVFIVPIRLDNCKVPRSLKMWQHIDYFPENRKDWAYQRILGSLKMRAQKLGIDFEGAIAEKKNAEQEKVKVERRKKIAAEKARKEREDREKKEIAKKARKDKERLEKREQEKAKQESLEKIRKEKEAEEKARQNALKKVRKRERTENIKNFFSKSGKRFFLVGGGIIALFLFGYIISNVQFPPKPEPTKIPATATLKLPTSTFFPTSTSLPTKTARPTEIPFTPTPTLGIGSTLISEKDGMTLLYVPAGEFEMGSEDGSDDEKPVHTVYLDSYWIDQTEVTNEMYAKCVSAGDCDPPSDTGSYTRDSYYGNSEFDDYPVIYVSWEDANNYCKWAGRRLPTEAEWEKAARGTGGGIYPWGDTFDGEKANFCDTNCSYGWENENYNDGYADTSPVGNYETGKSFYGAYDMAGNVWEWVSSLYKGYPYDALDGREDLSIADSRVLRGGSWYDDDYVLRSASRDGYYPAVAGYSYGFRCSRSRP